MAFVWCPSINGPTYASAYYPGDSYVDWIGWDGYDRKQSPSATLAQFQPFYNYWSTHGKPLVIGETGATTDQQQYLATLTTSLPTSMPDVHALLYYDSQSDSDWTLVDTPGEPRGRPVHRAGPDPVLRLPLLRELVPPSATSECPRCPRCRALRP